MSISISTASQAQRVSIYATPRHAGPHPVEPARQTDRQTGRQTPCPVKLSHTLPAHAVHSSTQSPTHAPSRKRSPATPPAPNRSHRQVGPKAPRSTRERKKRTLPCLTLHLELSPCMGWDATPDGGRARAGAGTVHQHAQPRASNKRTRMSFAVFHDLAIWRWDALIGNREWT